MKFIKLSLLVLPLMVMADNPIVPMDVDSADQHSSNQTDQVQERSVEVAQYESSTSYSDSEGIEDVIVTATRKETNIMETPIEDLANLNAIFTMVGGKVAFEAPGL